MEKLKEHLNRIAEQLTPESTLEDVYEQLALLADIEKSEEDEKQNRVFTKTVVKSKLDDFSLILSLFSEQDIKTKRIINSFFIV